MNYTFNFDSINQSFIHNVTLQNIFQQSVFNLDIHIGYIYIPNRRSLGAEENGPPVRATSVVGSGRFALKVGEFYMRIQNTDSIFGEL